MLVLGGGDGLAVREILRHATVEAVTLVDLDPDMTRLFATHPLLTPLNGNALNSPKVRVINADAFSWLEENADTFDFIVVDFPDPTNHALGKLYMHGVRHRLLERAFGRARPGRGADHFAAVCAVARSGARALWKAPVCR